MHTQEFGGQVIFLIGAVFQAEDFRGFVQLDGDRNSGHKGSLKLQAASFK
jgi:hypothetical protein